MSTSVIGTSVNVTKPQPEIKYQSEIHSMHIAWSDLSDLLRTKRIWTGDETLVLALFGRTMKKAITADSYKISQDIVDHIVCSTKIQARHRKTFDRICFLGPSIVRFGKHDPEQVLDQVAVLRPLSGFDAPYEVLMFGRLLDAHTTDGKPFKLTVEHGIYAVVTA